MEHVTWWPMKSKPVSVHSVQHLHTGFRSSGWLPPPDTVVDLEEPIKNISLHPPGVKHSITVWLMGLTAFHCYIFRTAFCAYLALFFTSLPPQSVEGRVRMVDHQQPQQQPPWEQIGSSFVHHYYKMFDTDRGQLASLYVSMRHFRREPTEELCLDLDTQCIHVYAHVWWNTHAGTVLLTFTEYTSFGKG